MCNLWSNYYQIFREQSGNNSKWKKNVPFARMNDAYNLVEMIEMRDGVKHFTTCFRRMGHV